MSIIYDFFKIVILILIVVVLIFYISQLPWYVFYRLQGKKRKKGESKKFKDSNFLKKILIEFPRQLVLDYLEFDPDTFTEYGFHLVTGKQGSGKTITVVYLLQKFRQMYPKLKIKTNMSYKYQDDCILHWSDITNSSNGIYGEIDVIDEVQNWFSSNQSKDFPVEMLREVTQQRKQRKMILGTSQVFTRVSKPIRENVYLVYEPKTYFGCLTIVHKYEPILDVSGNVVKKEPKGRFFFIHNKKLRDSFDTYQKILDMTKSGFVNRQEQLNNLSNSNE